MNQKLGKIKKKMSITKALVETEIVQFKTFLKENIESFKEQLETNESEGLNLKIRDCLTGIIILDNLAKRLEPHYER